MLTTIPTQTPRFRLFLHALPPDWPYEDFLLCGSAPLAARRIRDVRDLDVLMRPEKARELRALGVLEPAKEGDGGSGSANGTTLAVEKLRIVPTRVWVDGADRTDPASEAYLRDQRAQKVIDVFVEPLRVDLDFQDMWDAGERYVVAKRPLRIQSLEHTLAIKALMTPKPRPKDYADILTIAVLLHAGQRP